MASIKISELNEYTEVQDNDLFPVVDVANGETKKVKATNIGTGGKELIMVGDESVATKNTKLLIETDTLETLGTEVVNSLDGNETTKAPSVQAVKKYISKTIWEGQLYGGEEHAITLSNVKRFLKCYVSIPFESAGVFVSGSFTIEINNSNENIKDMTGSIVLDESDSQNHTNYYVIAAKYNIDTKKIYVSKAGFINLTNGSWNDRLSSVIYAIRRIETYD